MQLKQERNKINYIKIYPKRKTNHLKTNSMDNIFSSSKNKITDNSKLSPEKTNFKYNISNLNSINLNKNYIINLRNTNNPLSSLYSNNQDYSAKKKNNNSSYNGFCNSIQRKTYEILDNNNTYVNNYYRNKHKEKMINIKKLFINNSPLKNAENNNNKINIKNINDFNDVYNKNIRLLKSSRTNYNFVENNKRQQKYNNLCESYLDEGFFIDSKDMSSNFINDYYLRNKIINDRNTLRGNNYKDIYLNKTNYNAMANSNRKSSSKHTSNPKLYSKYNIQTERTNLNKYFNNLKIVKNIVSLKSENNKDNDIDEVKNTFFKNITSVSINNFYIKGNNNNQMDKTKSDINNNIDNIKNRNNKNLNIINNIQNITNLKNIEINKEPKEFIKFKSNENNPVQNKKIIDSKKTYLNMVKINNKMNDEKKNYIKEINKLKETINKIKTEENTNEILKESFNKLKKDYDNIDGEYNKLKEKINKVIEENQKLKGDNSNLNNEIINIKKQINDENNKIISKINNINDKVSEFCELNKSKNEEINKEKTENQNINDVINVDNNNKNDLNKLNEENTKIKKESEINLKENNNNSNNKNELILSENKLIQEKNIKLNEEINILKKDNEIKNEQFDLMSKELEKLKDDINEELKTSSTNLEKLNDEFVTVKNENIKYKEYIKLLEEEKEIEYTQKQKLIEENKSLKIKQQQLSQELQNLQEEIEELENTANVQNEYNQLYEEYNNLKESETTKYNDLLEKKNKLQEELNSLKKANITKPDNTISKHIEINIIRDNNNKKEKNKKIEIAFPEPVIIKKQEKRRPSKFKKNLTFDENQLLKEREIISEKNKDNNDKNIKEKLLLQIKTDNLFEKNDIKEETHIKENEEENINKSQDEKMSKALLRLKNGNEKNEKKQQNNEKINRINSYDKKFKKALFQNITDLLEDDSGQQNNNDNIEENNSNNSK